MSALYIYDQSERKRQRDGNKIIDRNQRDRKINRNNREEKSE